MPRAYPEEFRRRAVELPRPHEKSVSQIAAKLGSAQSPLHPWVHQADIDEGSGWLCSPESRALCQSATKNPPRWRVSL